MPDEIPPVLQVLETGLYCDDLARTAKFYRELFGLQPLVDTPRLCALDVNGRNLLLLFQKGATVDGLKTDGGWIPPHDGHGPVHFAFAIEAKDVDRWISHLRRHGVEIDGRTTWERGGTSLYFRDPDNHSVELVTQNTWRTF